MSDNSAALHTLVPTKPDAELAAEHRKAIADKLAELCVLMDSAQKDGFNTMIQLGRDFSGRNIVQQLILAKHY